MVAQDSNTLPPQTSPNSGSTGPSDQLIPGSNTAPAVVETSSGAVEATPKSEIGEQVTNGEILEFAKRKCKLCSSTGVITKVHIAPGVPDTYSKQICGCASQRFEKRMRDQIVQKTERVTNPTTGQSYDRFMSWHWKVGSLGNARAIIRRKLHEKAIQPTPTEG